MKHRSISFEGPKRSNQDAILEPLQCGSHVWCGVADGVGSTALGGLAAHSSLDEVQRAAREGESMEVVFSKLADRLNEEARLQQGSKSLSTTLSILRLTEEVATLGHVGDTRICHYRGKGVMLRTKDQTEVQKLLDEGALSRAQARRYPRRNVLLSAMSAGRDYDLFENKFMVQPRDRILLTSDGFHSKLPRGLIAEISGSHRDFDEFWVELIDSIVKHELDDDASCLAIEID